MLPRTKPSNARLLPCDARFDGKWRSHCQRPPKGDGPSLTVRYYLSHTSGSEEGLKLPANNPTEILKVADEVWIATALLHCEYPDREDFTVPEIVDRVAREGLSPRLRPGVTVHAYTHCVANKEPRPSGYRMLYATGASTRRLYRPSDPAHPARSGKVQPRRDQIPERYHPLLDWYETEYSRKGAAQTPEDPILRLRGLGREIWQGVDPDEYVRSLREGWE